jgi:hypothetical protein
MLIRNNKLSSLDMDIFDFIIMMIAVGYYLNQNLVI